MGLEPGFYVDLRASSGYSFHTRDGTDDCEERLNSHLHSIFVAQASSEDPTARRLDFHRACYPFTRQPALRSSCIHDEDPL